MAGICTSPYPIEKVGDSPYPYPVNAGIPRQNGDEFGQYPWGRVYLPSLIVRAYTPITLLIRNLCCLHPCFSYHTLLYVLFGFMFLHINSFSLLNDFFYIRDY